MHEKEAKQVETLVQHLNKLTYDPQASELFELLGGSIYWSDEYPQEEGLTTRGAAILIFHKLIDYRTSIIFGNPIDEYAEIWRKAFELCPTWPGFREERCSEKLLPRVRAYMKQAEQNITILEQAADCN